MSSDGGRTAICLVVLGVLALVLEAAERDSGGSELYLVPHLGRHPVLGPITVAPPTPGRVAVPNPALSVRTLENTEEVPAQTGQSRRRKHKRSPPMIEPWGPRDDAASYRMRRSRRHDGKIWELEAVGPRRPSRPYNTRP